MAEKLPDNWFELILTEPEQRQHLFYLFGQQELLPLKDKQLQERVSDFWDQILINHKKWKGNLLTPPLYRLSNDTISKKDIFYNIKEDFMWCCLYNRANYFSYDDKGNIHMKEKPVERIINIDTTYKNEKGVVVKDKSDKKTIATGFTLVQRSIIIDISMVGIIEKHGFTIINDDPKPEVVNDIAVEVSDKKSKKTKKETVLDDKPAEKRLANDLPIKKAPRKKTVKEDNTEVNSIEVKTKKAPVNKKGANKEEEMGEKPKRKPKA